MLLGPATILAGLIAANDPVVSEPRVVGLILLFCFFSIVAIILPDWVDLAHNMNWIKHPATATVSGVLAVGEIVMSEIPAIDNIFHIVMTAIHPVMGLGGSILCCRSIISKRRTASRADLELRSC